MPNTKSQKLMSVSNQPAVSQSMAKQSQASQSYNANEECLSSLPPPNYLFLLLQVAKKRPHSNKISPIALSTNLTP